MKPLHFAPAVEAEIEAAGDYYDAERPGLGSKFLDAIEDALRRLMERPAAHGPASGTNPDEEIRHVAVWRFPYRMVFQEREADLLILACMHVRREPGYWRNRQDG